MKFSEDSCGGALAAIRRTVPLYSFDDYRNYPGLDKSAWQEALADRVDGCLEGGNSFAFHETRDGLIYLVGGKISPWDTEHFGFGMAGIHWLFCPDAPESVPTMRRLLGEALAFLRERGVRFVSVDISGQDLRMIHLLEEFSFRYYQTTISSLRDCDKLAIQADPNVRLWREDDLPAVEEIAIHSQFGEGHYYMDGRFDRERVGLMYGKWIRTSWANQEPVAVFENGSGIAGYFAFVMDRPLFQTTKLNDGRMTSLAIAPANRGQGVGAALFRSVIRLMGDMGARYIVSEYAVKNHASARLHANHRFQSVNEKILFHLWL